MAASKTDILDMVKEFSATNKRPCPKKEVIAKHGEDAADVLKSLVEDGTLSVRRGRNGGYSPVDGAVAAVESTDEQTAEIPVENDVDLADQFAALEAKLAAAEAAENAMVESEQIPF